MKTYAEKLKDPRWQEFRQRAFEHHGTVCQTCGGEDRGRYESIHVHHRRYIDGRDPWEYEMKDVSILCWECHEEIHTCEKKWRDMIRSMPSWLVQEFDSMADAFKGLDPEDFVTWASYCKNHARNLKRRL